MHKRIALAAGAILVVVSLAVVLKQEPKSLSAKISRQSVQQAQERVPDHARYSALFRKVVVLKQKLGEAGGRIKSPIQREADLTDDQARVLDEVAADSINEVDKLDAKAKEIIEAFRAQYPNGVVPGNQPPPPPPPELRALQEQRNAIVLNGRDRLHNALGDKEFRRFDEHVKTMLARVQIPNPTTKE